MFFDKRRAKLDYRYVSITPLVQDPEGGVGTVKELPTFYFLKIRGLLANHKVFPLDGNLMLKECLLMNFFIENILLQYSKGVKCI